MPPINQDLVAILLSLVLTLVLTPIVRGLARHFGMVAKPKNDRWHKRPTALMGGVAIFLPVVLICALMVGGSPQFWVVLGSSTLLFLVGLVDDVLNLKPYQKLIGQLMGAMPVIYSGMTLPWTGSPALDIAITIFWLVGITNAVNLLDNMDGLAGGVALIAAVFLSMHFATNAHAVDARGLVILAAALVGFLIYNSHPATIFMGDCGSLFIGFFLASSALLEMDGGRSRSFLPVLAVPVLILVIPIFDTTLVMVLRKLAGRSASQGGRDHTSHRLVALGLSERVAVWMLYGFAIVSGLLGLLVRDMALDVSLALIVAFTLALTLLGVHLARVKVYDEGEVRAASEKPLVSFLVDLSYKRRIFEVLLDVLLIVLSYYASYALVYGPIVDERSRTLFLQAIPVLLFVKIAVFLVAGVYRGLWRYVSLDNIMIYTRAVITGSVLSVGSLVFAFRFAGYSRVVFVLDALILLFLVTGSRTAFRMLRQLLPTPTSDRSRRVLIYGAGDGGELLLRELLNNVTLDCVPVGFADDDPLKQGKVIHGLRVFGGNGSLRSICEQQRIKEILISTTRISAARLDEILGICQEADIRVKRMRIHFEQIAGQEDEAPLEGSVVELVKSGVIA